MTFFYSKPDTSTHHHIRLFLFILGSLVVVRSSNDTDLEVNLSINGNRIATNTSERTRDES